MTKMCIFSGPKLAKPVLKKRKLFGGVQMPKKLLNVFVPNVPKRHLEVSNDQHLHFLWAKTAEKTFKNPKCPQKSFGSVQ